MEIKDMFLKMYQVDLTFVVRDAIVKALCSI